VNVRQQPDLDGNFCSIEIFLRTYGTHPASKVFRTGDATAVVANLA